MLFMQTGLQTVKALNKNANILKYPTKSTDSQCNKRNLLRIYLVTALVIKVKTLDIVNHDFHLQ